MVKVAGILHFMPKQPQKRLCCSARHLTLAGYYIHARAGMREIHSRVGDYSTFGRASGDYSAP